MLLRLAPVVALLALSGPLFAQTQALEPGRRAYITLLQAFGPEGMETLAERGYVILYGDKKQPELLHAQWEPLRALAGHAQALRDFLRLYGLLRAGQNPGEDAPDISSLLDMPTVGAWTPAAKSAAAFLNAHLEYLSDLGPDPLTYKAEPLFSTPWGARFRSRVHADTLADFRPLARTYFAEFLAAPGSRPEAAAHLCGYVRSVYGKDIISLIQSDLTANSPSEAAIGWIAKYLLDQKRLYAVRRLPERLKDLERASELKDDLRDLGLLAPRLAAADKPLESARLVLDENARTQASFSAEKLHVHREVEGPLDVGDYAVVSAAYWVEGLEPGETLEVTEAGFVDNGALGLSGLHVESYRRKSGGPYIFTARVPLRRAGQNKYVLLLGAPGAQGLRLQTSILVSPRLDELALRAADAENLAASCRMEPAAREFAELDRRLSSFRKPQFKRLASPLESRVREVSRQASENKILLNAMPGVRLYASAEQCDFRADRARRALALLQELPAGCDLAVEPGSRPEAEGAAAGKETSLAAALSGLLEATERRGLNQQAFRAAASKAASAESACRFTEAAQLYSAALALLDSDTAARCGAWESEYTRIRLERLPRALSSGALMESFAQSYSEAARLYAAKDFSGALTESQSLLGRIDALPDGGCYRSQRREAEDLALAAGVSLGPGDPAALKASLPKDDFKRELQEVGAEREHERSIQSPTAPSAAPDLAPETAVGDSDHARQEKP